MKITCHFTRVYSRPLKTWRETLRFLRERDTPSFVRIISVQFEDTRWYPISEKIMDACLKTQFADNGARTLPNPRVTLGNENTSLLFLLPLSLSLSPFLSIQLVDSLNIQDHRDVAARTVAFAAFEWIDRRWVRPNRDPLPPYNGSLNIGRGKRRANP